MARLIAALTATGLAFTAVAVAAQAPGPESVTAALLAADSSADWRAVLRIAHPEAVREFQGQQIAMVSLMVSPDPRMGAFMQQVLDSTQLRMMSAFRDAQRARILDSVYHVPSLDSLTTLPADSVLARWYRGLSPGWNSSEPRYRIIGSVQPSDTLAYVILDLAWPSRSGVVRHGSQLQVLVLRRYEGAWRAMLDIVPNPTAGLRFEPSVDSL